MCDLPGKIMRLLRAFEPGFSGRVWDWASALLVGAILAPGPRTLASALRVLGLQSERQFQNYHRVLNRARWSSRALSRILLVLLLRAFVPPGAPVLVGVDETIERRRGAKIAAKGIYRDPVRSSKEHFVKASGLRWVSLQLLATVPWAQRVWALPVLTVLAPSERYQQERGLRHKTLADWGRQMLTQLRRWLPARYLVAVADSTYAALDLLAACARWSHPVVVITRLRLDAALYDPAPLGRPARWAARGRKARGNRPWPSAWRTPARGGRRSPSAGTAGAPGRSNSPLARRCGTTAASRPSPSAGCSFGIPAGALTHRRSCAPIGR